MTDVCMTAAPELCWPADGELVGAPILAGSGARCAVAATAERASAVLCGAFQAEPHGGQ